MSEFHYVRTRGTDGGVDACEGPAIGLDLETVLKDGLPPWNIALELVAALCEILDIADEDGEVHGEIHPKYVFIDETGAVSLEGFGVKRRKTRAPEGIPKDTRTDLYGLGYTAYRCFCSHPLPEVVPTEAAAHDDLVVDAALEIDLSSVPNEMQGDIQWYVAKLMEFEPSERPTALEAWRTFVAFAKASEGVDMAEWCAAALDGGGARRTESQRDASGAPAPPPPPPEEEELGAPVVLKGPMTGRLPFEEASGSGPSISAKAGATAFWTKAEMKKALERAEDDPEDRTSKENPLPGSPAAGAPPRGGGRPPGPGGGATAFWSQSALDAMARGDENAPRPRRVEGEGERRRAITASQVVPPNVPPPPAKAGEPFSGPSADRALRPSSPSGSLPGPRAERNVPPPPGRSVATLRPESSGDTGAARPKTLPVPPPPPPGARTVTPEPMTTLSAVAADRSAVGAPAARPAERERGAEPGSGSAPAVRPADPPIVSPPSGRIPAAGSAPPSDAVPVVSAPPAPPPTPPIAPPPTFSEPARSAASAPTTRLPPPPSARPGKRADEGGGLKFMLFGGGIAAAGLFAAGAVILALVVLVAALSWRSSSSVPEPMPAPTVVPETPGPEEPSEPTVPPEPETPEARPDPEPATPSPDPKPDPKPKPPARAAPEPPPAAPQPAPAPPPAPVPAPTAPKPAPDPKPARPSKAKPPKAGANAEGARVTIKSRAAAAVSGCSGTRVEFVGSRSFTIEGYLLPASCLVTIDGARGVFQVYGSGEVSCEKQGSAVVCDKQQVP